VPELLLELLAELEPEPLLELELPAPASIPLPDDELVPEPTEPELEPDGPWSSFVPVDELQPPHAVASDVATTSARDAGADRRSEAALDVRPSRMCGCLRSFPPWLQKLFGLEMAHSPAIF
jgi:hypothetical protein